MIPDSNQLIEKFILGELVGKELDDFQIKLKDSAEFARKVIINQEIASSILEQDVMDLRANLQDICSNLKNNPNEQTFFDFTQNLSINSDQNTFFTDISITENSLQQIHLETHLKCVTERVHQISSRTDQTQETILTNQINDFIFEEEIKDSILEKDVIELRNNLKEIISQGFINFSDFEIDQYLSNELPEDQMLEIGMLVGNNKKMANRIKLHNEIDSAINETDIFSLRNSLSEIIIEEQQISYKEIKRIDDYLLEYLNETDRLEFDSLMVENIKLKNETILHSEINNAIRETDVLNLRATLSEIVGENKQSTKIRKFIPDNIQNKHLRYVGVAASAAAIISTGLFTLTQEKTTSESIFKQEYHPYEATGLLRSAPISSPSFKGIELYNERKYDAAIAQFDIVLKENKEHPMCNFYTGLCYMEKSDFEKAIVSFQKVISEKDNLFTEQAEWYTALSLLKTNEKKNAYAILNQIVDYKGYYSKNAKGLLKKLK
jgi:hypothetical protein